MTTDGETAFVLYTNNKTSDYTLRNILATDEVEYTAGLMLNIDYK